MSSIERLCNAKRFPERFPYAYQTLRKKYINGELKGIVFKHSGRLWFDHDAWAETLQQAKEESIAC